MKEIIELLVDKFKVDLFRYKLSTLRRRTEKRMGELKLKGFQGYTKYIQKNPGEKDILFKTMLIGVTGFFRDPLAFNALKKGLKKLILSKRNGESVRIWCVGCASGQEAYSIAIIAMEIAESLRVSLQFKIFATDISRDNIAIARRGFYTRDEVKGVSGRRLVKYFTEKDDGYYINDKLRETIIFSRHDLTQDPPFIRMDIISCRNLFIYFNIQLQSELFRLFHFSLAEKGVLFLGKAENLKEDVESLFAPTSRHKIYNKVIRGEHILLPYRNRLGIGCSEKVGQKKVEAHKTIFDHAIDTIARSYSYPFVVVDEKNNILGTRGDLHLYLHLSNGVFSANIFELINKELRSDLYFAINKIKKTQRPVKGLHIRYKQQEQERIVSLSVLPLVATKHKEFEKNYLIIFEDVTRLVSAMSTITDKIGAGSDTELREELQAAKEQIRQYQQQLEHTQSSFISLEEELVATNNELKSSLENLETSNEELQSLNEELSVSNLDFIHTNGKLKEKESELLKSQIISEAIKQKYWDLYNNAPDMFASVNLKDKTITECNKAFYSKLGYSKLEIIGHSIMEFYHPDSYSKAKKAMREFSLSGRVEGVELMMLKKNKEVIWISLSATAIINDKGQMTASRSICRDITERKKAGETLAKERKEQQTILNSVPAMIFYKDKKDRIIRANRALADMLGKSIDELIGHTGSEIVPGKNQWEIDKKVMKTGKPVINMIESMESPEGKKWLQLEKIPFKDEAGEIKGVIGFALDITEQKKAEEALKESQQRLFNSIENMPTGYILWEPKTNKIIEWNKSAEKIFGFKKKEIIGKNGLTAIVPKETRGIVSGILKDLAKGKQVSFSEPGNNIKKDGTIISCIWYNTSLRRYDGTIFAILSIVDDVTEKHKQEQNLRESEKKFRGIFESSNDAIFIIDLVNDKIVSANCKALEMLRYTSVDSLLATPISTIHGGEMDKMRAFIDAVYKNGHGNTNELTCLRKDGIRIPVEISASVLEMEGNKHILASVHDVTERKKAESELTRQREEQQVILDSVPAIIFYKDKEDKFIRVNKALADAFQLPVDKIIGRTAAELSPTGKNYRTDDLEVIESGKAKLKIIEPVVTPDGTLWYQTDKIPYRDTNGEIIGIIGCAVDITERLKMESEMNKLSAAVMHSEASIIITDLKGNIEYINPQVLKSTGYCQKDLIGKNPRILKSGVTSKEEYEKLWKKISSGKTWKGEFNNKRKNGEMYWEAATISPILNNDGEIISYIAIKEDVTDKKNIEEELKVTLDSLEKEVSRRTRKLEQTVTTLNDEVKKRLRIEDGLQKTLKEKEILLNEISHRVKNNLQIITSLIGLQLEDMEDEGAREAFKETTYRIKSMALIHETLYKSKDFTRIDFNTYVKSLTNYVSHYFISSQVTININISDVSLSIDAATTCGLVLIELITNSFKYAFPNNKGKIHIRVETKTKGRYVINYSDNGIGFNPDFDVMKSDTLGLQLMHGLVGQLEGSVELLKGKGVNFKIQIIDQIKNV